MPYTLSCLSKKNLTLDYGNKGTHFSLVVEHPRQAQGQHNLQKHHVSKLIISAFSMLFLHVADEKMDENVHELSASDDYHWII